MPHSKQSVLITGATGFLGAWIISRLVSDGVRVVATDVSDDYSRLKKLVSEIPEDLIDFRICDVTDAKALETLADQNRFSSIIHLAALQIPQCKANPAAGAMVNVVGHINIFETARKYGISRIIYTSSIAAKPRGTANAPANLYGVFKKTDEEVARLYWEEHNLPSLGLRPHIVYGVGRDQGETSAITRAIRAAAIGESYQMPFATHSCFQYAGEVAEIFCRCLKSDWQGAVISDLTTRIESTDDVIAAILAAAPDAEMNPSEIDRPSPMHGLDNSPLHNIIGPWPETSLQVGVAQTLELFRKTELAADAGNK